MKEHFNRKILIHDYFLVVICMTIFIAFILSIFGYINITFSVLLTLEQTLFVALSAILLVFHESIISYSVLSNLTTKLAKLKKEDMELKVLSYIDSRSSKKEYQDFLSQVESNIALYKIRVQNYKRASYKIYAIFSFIGVLLIFLVLFFGIQKHFLLSLAIYTQIILLLVWIVSAYQADKQKQNILNSLKTKEISKDIKTYIKLNQEKSIEDSLDFGEVQ